MQCLHVDILLAHDVNWNNLPCSWYNKKNSSLFMETLQNDELKNAGNEHQSLSSVTYF